MSLKYIQPGSGSGTGTEAAPYFFNQLSTAVNAADGESERTLIFTDGSYTTTSASITVAKNIILKAQNVGKATIQRTGLSAGGTPTYISCSDTTNTSETLKFDGLNFQDIYFIILATSSSIIFDKVLLDSSTTLAWSGTYGMIGATSSQAITITNSSFAPKFHDGSTKWIDAANMTATSCSFYLDNSAMTTGSLAYNGTLASGTWKNNIFMSEDSSRMDATQDIANITSNCCFHQFGTNNAQGAGSGDGTNNVFGNPLFIDTSTSDLRLRPSSPCINAGTSS